MSRVIEVSLSDNLALDLSVAAPGAVIAAYGRGPAEPIIPFLLAANMNVRLMCVLVYTTPQHLLQKAATEIGVTLAEAALRPLPTLHFPLAEIADVHEAVEQGAVGKIVVDLPAVVPRAV